MDFPSADLDQILRALKAACATDHDGPAHDTEVVSQQDDGRDEASCSASCSPPRRRRHHSRERSRDTGRRRERSRARRRTSRERSAAWWEERLALVDQRWQSLVEHCRQLELRVRQLERHQETRRRGVSSAREQFISDAISQVLWSWRHKYACQEALRRDPALRCAATPESCEKIHQEVAFRYLASEVRKALLSPREPNFFTELVSAWSHARCLVACQELLLEIKQLLARFEALGAEEQARGDKF